MQAAKKQNSPALAADAVHYRLDGITSLFATIALLVGAFVPEWSHKVDHFGALGISVVMVIVGLNSARNNMHQILDRVPDQEFFDRVKNAAQKAKGVLDTEKIRIQLYGPDAHVDIDVEVDPHLTVEVAHGISQKVRAEIQKEWPAVRDVTVHIEPYYPNDH
jgi:cation diffusion facilitator family transporter